MCNETCHYFSNRRRNMFVKLFNLLPKYKELYNLLIIFQCQLALEYVIVGSFTNNAKVSRHNVWISF